MAYTKIHADWQDYPSTATPIRATDLEHIEQGIFDAAATADAVSDPAVWRIPRAIADLPTSTERTAALRAEFEAIRAAAVKPSVVIFPGVEIVGDASGAEEDIAGFHIFRVWAQNIRYEAMPGFKFTLDPTIGPLSPHVVFSFGRANEDVLNFTWDVPGSASHSAIQGGKYATPSLYFCGLRRDSTDTGIVDGITWGPHCVATDTRIGATVSKRTPATQLPDNPYDEFGVKVQSRVQNVVVDQMKVVDAGNRSIEFQQVNKGIVRNVEVIESETHTHLNSFTENVEIIGAHGTVVEDVIRLNFGVKNVHIRGSRVRFSTASTSSFGAFHMHCEPTTGDVEIDHVYTYDNVWPAGPVGGESMDFFISEATVNSMKWHHFYSHGDTFEGIVRLHTGTSAFPKSELYEFEFWNASIQELQTRDGMNAHDVRFYGGRIINDAEIHLKQSKFVGTAFDGAVSVGAGSVDLEFWNCPGIDASTLVNYGTNTTVNGVLVPTIVVPNIVDPATLDNLVTGFSNGPLTAGTFSTQTPVAGAQETGSRSIVGTNPPSIVDDVLGDGTAHASHLHYSRALQTRLVSEAFVTPRDQPLTIIGCIRVTDDGTNDHSLVSGYAPSGDAPLVRVNRASPQIFATAGGLSIRIDSRANRFAWGQWVAFIIVLNGTGSRLYVNELTSLNGSLPQIGQLSGIRTGSTRTGNAPYMDGDEDSVYVVGGALHDLWCKSVMRYYADRRGITLSP